MPPSSHWDAILLLSRISKTPSKLGHRVKKRYMVTCMAKEGSHLVVFQKVQPPRPTSLWIVWDSHFVSKLNAAWPLILVHPDIWWNTTILQNQVCKLDSPYFSPNLNGVFCLTISPFHSLTEEKPLRLPILKVHDHPEVGCVIVGRVETGSIRSGNKVTQPELKPRKHQKVGEYGG